MSIRCTFLIFFCYLLQIRAEPPKERPLDTDYIFVLQREQALSRRVVDEANQMGVIFDSAAATVKKSLWKYVINDDCYRTALQLEWDFDERRRLIKQMEANASDLQNELRPSVAQKNLERWLAQKNADNYRYSALYEKRNQ